MLKPQNPQRTRRLPEYVFPLVSASPSPPFAGADRGFRGGEQTARQRKLVRWCVVCHKLGRKFSIRILGIDL